MGRLSLSTVDGGGEVQTVDAMLTMADVLKSLSLCSQLRIWAQAIASCTLEWRCLLSRRHWAMGLPRLPFDEFFCAASVSRTVPRLPVSCLSRSC